MFLRIDVLPHAGQATLAVACVDGTNSSNVISQCSHVNSYNGMVILLQGTWVVVTLTI